MSLYPYIYKYFKFRVNHPVIHVGALAKKEACLSKEGLKKCSIVPVVLSRVPLPSQSETHVLSMPNMCHNLNYRRLVIRQ